MARKLTKAQIAADRAILKALKAMPDYKPMNPAYSIEALIALDEALSASEGKRSVVEEDFVRVRQAFARVTEDVNVNSVNSHDALVGAKSQVLAQYGADSLEVKAVGWTRKSERKRPARKADA